MKGILKRKDVAAELGCSESKVHYLWRDGLLTYHIDPTSKRGDRFSTPKDINKFLEIYKKTY